MMRAGRKLRHQRVQILHKNPQNRIFVVLRQPAHHRFPRLFDIFGAGIFQDRRIVDLHIHAIFAVSVLNKNQVMRRKKGFQSEMPAVVIARGIVIADTIQTVLHRMIVDFLIIQIISDGVGIAEHIDVLVLFKIHRHIGLLQLSV